MTETNSIVEKGEQSLISILFKGGNRSDLWYTGFITEVRGGAVYELTYTLADPTQKIHHIECEDIQMITVKQTKPL